MGNLIQNTTNIVKRQLFKEKDEGHTEKPNNKNAHHFRNTNN